LLFHDRPDLLVFETQPRERFSGAQQLLDVIRELNLSNSTFNAAENCNFLFERVLLPASTDVPLVVLAQRIRERFAMPVSLSALVGQLRMVRDRCTTPDAVSCIGFELDRDEQCGWQQLSQSLLVICSLLFHDRPDLLVFETQPRERFSGAQQLLDVIRELNLSNSTFNAAENCNFLFERVLLPASTDVPLVVLAQRIRERFAMPVSLSALVGQLRMVRDRCTTCDAVDWLHCVCDCFASATFGSLGYVLLVVGTALLNDRADLLDSVANGWRTTDLEELVALVDGLNGCEQPVVLHAHACSFLFNEFPLPVAAAVPSALLVRRVATQFPQLAAPAPRHWVSVARSLASLDVDQLATMRDVLDRHAASSSWDAFSADFLIAGAALLTGRSEVLTDTSLQEAVIATPENVPLFEGARLRCEFDFQRLEFPHALLLHELAGKPERRLYNRQFLFVDRTAVTRRHICDTDATLIEVGGSLRPVLVAELSSLSKPKVIVVGGPSGSGKTLAAIEASTRKSNDLATTVSTLYLLKGDLGYLREVESLTNSRKKRNELVVTSVLEGVQSCLRCRPASATSGKDLQRLEECFTSAAVIILDEVGMCANFVRGVCAADFSAVATYLGVHKVVMVVVGTGLDVVTNAAGSSRLTHLCGSGWRRSTSR